jgi:UDP-glucose 4-epimerase
VSLSKKRFFITGGAGFIGSNLAGRLIGEGHNVTVYDNLSGGREEFIKHHYQNPDFRFINGDLLDKEKLGKAIKEHDFVFHLASNPDIAKSMIETDLDLRLGIIATFNVIDAMRINGIKKIAYPSGSGVYGDVGLTETPEDFGPLLPVSMYGASKLGAEGIISAFCHMFDMQAYIFRFANVVGERQTHGVVLDFIKKLKKNPEKLEILGDGNQSKSYIHISDVISAMLFVIENSNEKVNLFNLATGDYITVNEIANITVEEMGLKNVEFAYTGGKRGWKGDVPIVRFDLTKIHNSGWKPKYNSEEAVRETTRALLKDRYNVLN